MDLKKFAGMMPETLPDRSELSLLPEQILGVTLLHVAAFNGQQKAVEGLLKGSTSVDIRDQEMMTPLHWAAIGGHPQICEAFIKHGAEVNAKDQHEKTPLQWAVELNHSEVCEILQQNGAQG
ncbi:GA-binding protein subunit beta-1-like [Branchiostoma floridae]|uniref:GA-binding protein subunit beta-1-like n=1 Tax=Branchiostoma floridae TaxID=7739 RepID=A0A9J7KSP1_BRAFL|nr:GA-binding protein subunit beta-1-like [Branchiostoma floridae]